MESRATTVQNMVIQELRWDKSIDAANIGVSVNDGAVTLSGHVPSYYEKDRAEKAAKRVRGVHAVANEIEVHLPNVSRRGDTEIAMAISQAMAMNVNIPQDTVQATVRNAWVTLDGTVSWDFQRLTAAKIARDAHGVTGITNNIILEQRPESREIERDITAALHRLADIDAHSIHVSASKGVATITGRVSSWREVTTARRAASAAPGINQVNVQLKVEPLPLTAGV